MPALRIFHFSNSERREDGLPLLNHILQTSPLLEDLHIAVRMSPKDLDLTRHDGIRRLVLESFALARYAECDDDWNWIAGSFPALQHLAIRHQNHLTLRTTWRTLPSVVIRCTGLEELEINLHVPTFFLHEAALWDTPLPSLRVLKFERLFIQKADIDSFANYLAKLCPSVKELGIVNFYELFVAKVTIGGRTREQPRIDGSMR